MGEEVFQRIRTRVEAGLNSGSLLNLLAWLSTKSWKVPRKDFGIEQIELLLSFRE